MSWWNLNKNFRTFESKTFTLLVWKLWDWSRNPEKFDKTLEIPNYHNQIHELSFKLRLRIWIHRSSSMSFPVCDVYLIKHSSEHKHASASLEPSQAIISDFVLCSPPDFAHWRLTWTLAPRTHQKFNTIKAVAAQFPSWAGSIVLH